MFASCVRRKKSTDVQALATLIFLSRVTRFNAYIAVYMITELAKVLA